MPCKRCWWTLGTLSAVNRVGLRPQIKLGATDPGGGNDEERARSAMLGWMPQPNKTAKWRIRALLLATALAALTAAPTIAYAAPIAPAASTPNAALAESETLPAVGPAPGQDRDAPSEETPSRRDKIRKLVPIFLIMFAAIAFLLLSNTRSV